MADTELDEILKDWEHIIKSVAMAEIYGVVNVGFSYNRQEAKQKLLKLIDKEVTRSRIDELKMLPISTDPQSRRDIEKRIKELAIQEEGTDNETT